MEVLRERAAWALYLRRRMVILVDGVTERKSGSTFLATPSLGALDARLPVRRTVRLNTPSFQLTLNGLNLLFEFESVKRGQVSVTETMAAEAAGRHYQQLREISATDIPTSEVMLLSWDTGLSSLDFRLCYGIGVSVDIKFSWEAENT